MGRALIIVVALALPGCAPRAPAPPAAPAATSITLAPAEFLPPVGRRNAPRVDAFFAPGAQSACAWLPDHAFWNGDVECALVDAGDVPLGARPAPAAGPHRALPAATRDLAGAGGALRVRAFMPWRGGDADTALWTRLRIDGAAPLRLAFRSGARLGHPLHPDAPFGERFTYTARGDRVLRDGRTIAIVRAAPGEARAGPLTTLASAGPIPSDVRAIVVAGAAPRAWDVWLAPVGGAARGAEPPDRAASFESSLGASAAAWNTEVARGAAIEFPDARVDAALLSARRLLVGNRERRDGALHFLGNPFQYRDVYLRDGARTVRALALLGRADLAGQALASLYAFQWPNGAFLSQRGQLDGSGQALWALAEYAALGGDRSVVDRLLVPALRGAGWIAIQRAHADARGGPAAGLMPYAEPRDNELATGHLFGTDAWALAGLESLADLLRRRAHPAAAHVAEEAAAYRARLVETWDRAARRQGRPLPPLLEGGGRDWGNVSAAYPCRVFAADDARVRALDGWLRARAVDGLLTCGSADSIHHYLGFDGTEAALRRGDRGRVAADLLALLDHAQADGSGFELAGRDGGFGENLPPHGTFAAMFVDLARSCLAYERGDSLVLLAGVPAWNPVPRAAALRLRDAPTTFGGLDLTLSAPAGPDVAELIVRLPAPALVEWPPPRIVRAVVGDHGAATLLGPRRFALPEGAASWRVELFAAQENLP